MFNDFDDRNILRANDYVDDSFKDHTIINALSEELTNQILYVMDNNSKGDSGNENDTFEVTSFPKLSNSIEDIDTIIDTIAKSNNKIIREDSELKSKKEKLKSDKKVYFSKVIYAYRKVVASALVFSSVVLIGFAGNPLAKRVSKNKGICNRTTSIYVMNEDNLELTANPNYNVYYTGQSDKVYIKFYEPWDENKERQITSYDVSDLEVSEIKDYFKYDVGILEGTTSTEKLDDYTLYPNESNKEVMTVEITSYDRDNIENESYENAMGIYYVIYTIFIIISLIIWILSYNNLGYVYEYNEDVKERFDKLKEYKCLADFKKQRQDIVEFKNLMMEEINKNDELRKKYLELFDEYKYLMNDPSELISNYQKLISELDIKKIKKSLKF